MSNTFQENELKRMLKVVNYLVALVLVLVVAVMLTPILVWKGDSIVGFFTPKPKLITASAESTDTLNYWRPKDIETVEDEATKELLKYGKELIMHTSTYLGPKGSVLQLSNGLNCQNCHLEAGTKVFGNNYGAVSSTYPKFRARSGSQENIYKRVNDCFERSLNGEALDTMSKEMQAISSYINYIGSNVSKGNKAIGSGLKELDFLDRAADPTLGKEVYVAKCQSCHQADGGGQLTPDGKEYSFPPLWGPHSYNDAAGLYRLSNFAKYVKYNMPQGVSHGSPQLSDQEAWDVAAFVNSQPRPHKNTPFDWPDISKKPIDHPKGPYADEFDEKQHKYGPFKPIKKAQKQREEKQKTI